MYFYLSKIIWPFFQPSALLWFIALLGVWGLYRQRRWGKRLVIVGLVGLFLAGVSPLSYWLLVPLEERFPRAEVYPPPPPPAGILVLGGALSGRLSEARGQPALNEAAERVTAALALARRYPQAKLVFTGGNARLFTKVMSEAQAARMFFERLGVAPERILLESGARNTGENARLTRQMVRAQAGARWLLVTSAYHMPRAMGVFRKAGFAVEPWPVDYRTGGWADLWRWELSPIEGLRRLDMAAKEWVGLLVYWLRGRTDSLFPGPIPSR